MSASAKFVRDFCELANAKGLDSDAMLENAGIDRQLILKSDARVASEQLASLVVDLWDLLDDEGMGLSGEPIPRGTFRLMGKLAVGEINLRDALNTAIELHQMATGAFSIELTESEGVATLAFRTPYRMQSKHYLLAEITSLAWHRIASWLIAEHVALQAAYFDYPTPEHVREYVYLFPGRHVFDAEFLGFSFSAAFLDREVCQTRETLTGFLKNCPVELFVQPKQDFSVAGELKRVLRRCLSDGFPRVEEAADHLHMTKRTMMRKLKEEGTSYQEIKDLVRRDRAVFLLRSHPMSISDIAVAVGFSDAAVFARSFKSWTGVSPRQYRSSDRGEGDCSGSRGR